jgi:hypothetical protein
VTWPTRIAPFSFETRGSKWLLRAPEPPSRGGAGAPPSRAFARSRSRRRRRSAMSPLADVSSSVSARISTFAAPPSARSFTCATDSSPVIRSVLRSAHRLSAVRRAGLADARLTTARARRAGTDRRRARDRAPAPVGDPRRISDVDEAQGDSRRTAQYLADDLDECPEFVAGGTLPDQRPAEYPPRCTQPNNRLTTRPAYGRVGRPSQAFPTALDKKRPRRWGPALPRS